MAHDTISGSGKTAYSKIYLKEGIEYLDEFESLFESADTSDLEKRAKTTFDKAKGSFYKALKDCRYDVSVLEALKEVYSERAEDQKIFNPEISELYEEEIKKIQKRIVKRKSLNRLKRIFF
jgi:hypothetical protein